MSEVVSNTLNKDSLKKQASKIVSKENVRKIAEKQISMDDYKAATESLDEKKKMPGERERKKFIDSKKDVVSNRFNSKIKNPIQDRIDSIKTRGRSHTG